jgi:hypothetical protein
MIREPQNVDFYTTGRQPTEKEFAVVSEWIKKRKAQLQSRKLRSAKNKKKRQKA